MMNQKNAIVVVLGLLSSACADSDTGSLSVLVEAEDVIIDGLEPGSDLENIADGWGVTFDRYVVVLGEVEVELAADPEEAAEAHESFAIDLTAVRSSGEPLWEIDGLEPGRYNVYYGSIGAAEGATAHPSVTSGEFDEMVAGNLTHKVVGALNSEAGVSCPPAGLAEPPSGLASVGDGPGGDPCYPNLRVAFAFGLQAEARYGPCEAGGLPGVAIPAGGIQTAAVTIHGDHIFFNGFPEGSESGTLRLAQWLADCDLNLDGEVTLDELERLRPSDLAEIDERFQLGGSPISPLETMADYVTAQLMTQGHFQGEGECPIDGVAHDHDHDHDDDHEHE